MFTKSRSLYSPDNPVEIVNEPTPFHTEFVNGVPTRIDGYHDYVDVSSTLYRARSAIANGLGLHSVNPQYDNLSQVDAARSIVVPQTTE